MLDRIKDWEKFSDQIKLHIKQYTIPQYQSEDNESDQVGILTSTECSVKMKYYLARFGKGQRGDKEQLRDMLKLAHYAQFTYNKLKEELGGPDVYE